MVGWFVLFGGDDCLHDRLRFYGFGYAGVALIVICLFCITLIWLL